MQHEVIEWMQGNKTRAPHNVEEVLLASDSELEHWHDWVQWAFPLPEASKAIYGAPVADADTLKIIGRDAGTREVSVMLASRYLDFLVATREKWATHPDHNWLRISRVIRSLMLQGNTVCSDKIYRYAIAETGTLPSAQTAWQHWNAAHNGLAL